MSGGKRTPAWWSCQRRSDPPAPAGRGERRRDGTIRGDRPRGPGLLDNELYLGKLVRNRQRFVKHSETGRRLARPVSPGGWIVAAVGAAADRRRWRMGEASRARTGSLADPEPMTVRPHPNLPELYRKEVARLREALAKPLIRDEAVAQLRSLIAKVTVRPGEGWVELVVEGGLTAMPTLGSGSRAEAFAGCSGRTVKVVAGAGNRRELPPLIAAV